MDETAYDIDARGLREASRRFPAHPQAHRLPHPEADLSYLASPGADFARRLWDESGR